MEEKNGEFQRETNVRGEKGRDRWQNKIFH